MDRLKFGVSPFFILFSASHTGVHYVLHYSGMRYFPSGWKFKSHLLILFQASILIFYCYYFYQMFFKLFQMKMYSSFGVERKWLLLYLYLIPNLTVAIFTHDDVTKKIIMLLWLFVCVLPFLPKTARTVLVLFFCVQNENELVFL